MAMEYVGEGGLTDIRDRIFKRRGQVTLDASGNATITFDPPISLPRQPYVQLTPRVASGADVVVVNLVDSTFTTNASGLYTGVTIRGGRVRGALPTLTPLSGGLTLISQVVTGVNAIVTALSGLSLVQTNQVSGIKVDWLAF